MAGCDCGIQLNELRSIINERDRRYDERFVAQERALDKAEQSHEKRLDSMNEFRAQLKDQSTSFLTRVEYDAKNEILMAMVTDLRARFDTQAGSKKGSSESWAVMLAIATVVATVISIVIRALM